MREVGGGRTRSYWISFILSAVSLWIVFVYSLLGPGIPLTEYAHSQGYAALTEHAHSQGYAALREHAHAQGRHTGASSRDCPMHTLRDRPLGAKGSE